MPFVFKSFQAILKDMVAKFLASTGVNDINPGSVVTTFLEAAAQEDAQQYFQMYQVIRNYNLDTTEGTDLDNRATEYGLTRLEAQKASGVVAFTDSSITKNQTNIYSGSRGPISGQTYIDVDDASSFSASGSIIVGRNTDNAETVAYSLITSFGNFDRITLVGALVSDHGTNETVIESQGGNRLIPSGTVVLVPSSDISDEIQFVTTQDATILDGESTSENASIEAVSAGTESNVAAGTIIDFATLPFPTALVSNPQAITNGSDRETDAELRDRIRLYIQSLSRGTKEALLLAVTDLESSDDNKRIVSANVVDAITLEDIVYLYVDDGTGLEPTFENIGTEIVLNSATGGESFLQLDNFPVLKAQVETLSSSPFNVIPGETLILSVNNEEETIIFQDTDFKISGSVSAYEIATAINNKTSLVEARTSGGGTKVVLRAIENENEHIQIVGGTANSELGFPSDEEFTLELYKFDGNELIKLSKDGSTAAIENDTIAPYNLSGTETLTIVVDGKTANPQTVTFQNADFLSPGTASAAEVVARINAELSGAVASVTQEGQKVTITSNTLNSSDSIIQVTGGTANAILNFDTTPVVGSNRDYTLNRFNGQIELEQAATSGDQYTAGSTLTRGFLMSANSEPFVLADGDSLTFSVDGGAAKLAIFNTAEFSNIAQATAAEVAAVINAEVDGATALDFDGQILVRTNTWDESIGSIEITSISGTAGVLGFEVGTEKVSIRPHQAYTVSDVGPYVFAVDDNLVVVIDKDEDQKVFNITMNLDGTVTTGDASAPYTTFIGEIDSLSQNFNTQFVYDSDLEDFTIEWLTGANAGDTSSVSSYSATTGLFTLAVGLTNAISATDTFTIIPTTAKNVVTYLSSLVVSSLPSSADIELSEDGTKVQITSINTADGVVQVTGGTANAELSFGTAADEGHRAYANYTGIIQKAQHTIDGLDSDLITYPGIKAAGVQVEVLPPVVQPIEIDVDLSIEGGADQNLVKDKAISLISSYVNNLGVGDDVVLNEMVDVLMEIDGVLDVGFNQPTVNIPIADNEIARIARDDIIVG